MITTPGLKSEVIEPRAWRTLLKKHSTSAVIKGMHLHAQLKPTLLSGQTAGAAWVYPHHFQLPALIVHLWEMETRTSALMAMRPLIGPG